MSQSTHTGAVAPLSELQFDNRFTRSLPADPITSNTPRQIAHAIYTRVQPVAVSTPQLVAYAPDVAQSLGLTAQACRSTAFANVFSGQQTLAGMDPHATCYGGHQFGNWAGQLGDGRAINLGEVLASDGSHQMLQLKGAGPTPYSRTADGLAVLRSSIREFLCSEAMHHLGVPSTRALSLTLTGTQVMRDMLYDGNAALEPGAVVCRVAPSFIRFGHFQMLAARDEQDLLRQLTDYVIRTEFAQLLPAGRRLAGPLTVDDYLSWFRSVCLATAQLVVHWQRVGFVHGVMNTDNMSITGLTIDYGPYGWLDNYDPGWTPNTTDAAQRRYRFGQQAAVAQWNLMQLASAIVPLLGRAEPLQEVLQDFARIYQELALHMQMQKLGLSATTAQQDQVLVEDLEQVLCSTEIDMTLFFRCLMSLTVADDSTTALQKLRESFYHPERLSDDVTARIQAWLDAYLARMACVDPSRRQGRMQQANPKYVLRNYLAQLAIDDAEQGDYGKVHELMTLLRNPYAEQHQYQRYALKRPDWALNRVGCSALSCSS